ncbi:MAG: response regulator [Planctomycetota bacterium]|nr:MAG: response regulator [Planctomycetota bacterium]REK20312.1 MAG: response regulator [Planctomycetota bacterium]REK26809.1 MAG: response regulator [Planctomycetota bacterium]
MANVSKLSARMLLEGRRTLADLVALRLEGLLPAGETVSTSATHQQTNQHVETFLLTLAACVEYSSPRLFQDYLRWSTTVSKAASPYTHEVDHILRKVLETVRLQFPREVSHEIASWVEAAASLPVEIEDQGDGGATGNPYDQLQRDYLHHLLTARRDSAVDLVVDAINHGVGIESIYLHVILPSQRELGRLWQAGDISVAQEHYCTAATQFVMSQLHPYFLTSGQTDKTLLATCVGDELHEVGLRIIADLFEANGWNTIYLGANTPATSITQELVNSGSNILAISTTMTQHLFNLAEVIREVRSHEGCTHVKILAGGHPFNVDPFLWKRIGADAGPGDATAAIEIAEQFLRSSGETGTPRVAPDIRGTSVPTEFVERDTDDDLSRLNNNLVTLQRKLAKANAELAAQYQASQEKTEALERADRRKNEFLAMLAHELRGPLAPMQFAVALLERDDVDITMIGEVRETLKRQLQQMSRLISDLLDASRLAYGKIELKRETVELSTIVERAVELVRPLISQKRQELVVEFNEESIALDGDLIRLTQVFANLLTNAAKYTEEEGKIWLTCARERDSVVVDVRDNGVGIEPDLLADIFSTFTQEQRSRKRSMGGLGLGLSLVKQLVELHGGSVRAASAGANKGSTFSVNLPVLDPYVPKDGSEADSPTSLQDISAPPRFVLVVEDAAGVARITALLLQSLGHSPTIAGDGRSAIQQYQESGPEMVILDLELPDMNGLEVARELRRLDTHNQTLIVALTGHGDDEHRRLAEENGCDEYLVKPVGLNELARLAIHPKFLAENGSI